MVTAGHYVLENMYKVLDEKNLIEVREIFRKFLTRYNDDEKLREIYNCLTECVYTPDAETLGRVQHCLEELKSTRRPETNGSIALWHPNRRPGLTQFSSRQ
jgi:hypothetical protein